MDRGDARDEIALAFAAEIVDELARGLVDQGLQALDRARREVGTRDLAVFAMLGRIHVDDGPDRRRRLGREGLAARDRHSRRVQEDLRQLGDLDDVGVLRDRPERRKARRFEIFDGRFASQPGPFGVGKTGTSVRAGIDELQGIDGDGGQRDSPFERAERNGRGDLRRRGRFDPRRFANAGRMPARKSRNRAGSERSFSAGARRSDEARCPARPEG